MLLGDDETCQLGGWRQLQHPKALDMRPPDRHVLRVDSHQEAVIRRSGQGGFQPLSQLSLAHRVSQLTRQLRHFGSITDVHRADRGAHTSACVKSYHTAQG